MANHDNDGFYTLSARTNLRTAFDVWPFGEALPTGVDEVARGALMLTVRDLLSGRGAMMSLVRFAGDGVSLWLLDELEGMPLDDFVRAIVGVFEPAAFAIAVIQPMTLPDDPTVRGVHCRAMLGDDIADLTGEVSDADGPAEGRTIPKWAMSTGRAIQDRARWIGVPPTRPLRLSMRGTAYA